MFEINYYLFTNVATIVKGGIQIFTCDVLQEMHALNFEK